MAECVDDGEFWLPPEFLTDDDIFTEKKPHQMGKKGGEEVLGLENEFAAKSLFSFDFPYGFGTFGASSDLNSPVESVVGSTETESDEEDHLARQMAHTTLEDDFARSDWLFGAGNAKGRVLSGSPQSTLCGVGNGCGCKPGLNRPVKVSSPPPPQATWDLLYAAAGEVAKMKFNGGGAAAAPAGAGYAGGAFNDQRRGLLGGPPPPPPREPSPVTVPVKTSNPSSDVGFYQHASLSYQQLQASQFQQMMQQQQSSAVWAAPQQNNKAAAGIGVLYQQQCQQPLAQQQNRGRSGNIGKPLGLSASAWPSLQQAQQQQQPLPQPPQQQQQVGGGSGMRAVFLGNPGGKRECAGTGVFFPRRTGAVLSESRKKSAGSTTVLLPARVVQALNLNLDDIGVQQPYQARSGSGARFAFDNGATVLRNNNIPSDGVDFGSNQKLNLSSRAQPGMEVEVRLPQEWTY